MTPMGQLSPIDPSVDHPLGPQVQIPGQAQAQITPVNVEDVNAFIGLAKDEFRLASEAAMVEAFKGLAQQIHPLVLGAVQRSREQIAFLATNLLNHHMSKKRRKVRKIVNTLVRERFSHSYIVGRSEAEKALELKITRPDDALTALIVGLFSEYNEIAQLSTPYNPEALLGTANQGTFTFNRAIIEIPEASFVYRTVKEIRRVQLQQPNVPVPMEGFQERLLQEEWLLDNTL